MGHIEFVAYVTELKFNTTGAKTRHQILSALAKQAVSLFILIVNKHGASIRDTPENYAGMINAILPDCLEHSPNLRRILIDRHFTRQADQDKLTRLITRQLNSKISVEYVDSLQDSRIDLADFVAGAVAQRRKYGDRTCEDLIRDKITVYKVVQWREKEKW